MRASIIFLWFVFRVTCFVSEREDDPTTSQPQPRAPSLAADLNGRVQDRTGIPGGDLTDLPEEYKAYCLALNTARTASNEALAASAQTDVSYAQLFANPERYRGQVIRFRGRLKRVRSMDPPAFLRDEVPLLYECGIFDEKRFGDHPMMAVVTELPPGVVVADDMEIPITIDGYFFKLWRYRAGDAWRDAPLLIARTIRPDPGTRSANADDTNHAFTRELVIGAIALFGLTVGLMIALSWWYRRGDARVRERMVARRRLEQGFQQDSLHDAPDGGG